MLLRLLIPILIFIPLAILQLTVVPLISIDFIVPDLILILLVFFTLRNGQIYGSILGFLLGLLFDLVSGGLIGAAMFSKTLAGFLAGYFFSEKRVETNLDSTMFIVIIFICAFVDSLFYSLLASSETDITIINLFFEFGILPAFYTAAVSLPIIVFKPSNRII
ncbi:MAG: rod shape-determining protein MreD [Bacteroidetes bacterium]|nr:rod shape-determining protein MreD [Bacteroidota bacterium]